jgi:AcrR family transcriptional regulator
LGYHPASVSDILAEAGVARGTFYNHFESKQAIFHAVLLEVMEEIAGAVVPIDLGRPIPAQVRDNVGRVVRALVGLGDGARVLMSDAAGIDADGMTVLAEFYGRALARIERALRTGQERGVVRPCDAAVVAPLLLGMVREPVVQGLLRGQRPDAESLAREVEEFLWRGLISTG